MRCDAVVGKRMLEARAGGFLKMTAGYERERTGGFGTVPWTWVGGRDGGRGTDDLGSEQEEKIKRLCGDGMG